ncbi:MAG TPA: GNAT family N-acetyltransferase [Tepidiformaceae bacterium]|nr:GNAT family N-acetyltransferase [Tepidiformaceae bacterium]HMO95403.1 GNAT family N-acetyltransferase [Tepidiformaceae bacterium]
MLAPLELLQIQAGTLFRLDATGRLVCVNEPGDRPAPRVFVGSASTGERVVHVRSDVAESLAESLKRCADEASLLACLGSAVTLHRGPTFVFDRRVEAPQEVVSIADPTVLHPALASWAVDVQRGTPLFGVMQEGQVVSVCYSSREGHRACEAGVETVAEFRGRGLGRFAVLAWAASVQRSGRIALYSTTHENLASRRLAAALGLRYFAEDWSFE